MLEQYQPNCNTFQSDIKAFQVNYAILEADSTESSESSLDRGSLEEFDEFCKEGKVKEVVDFLYLLQKQSVSVDLPHYLQLIQACGEAEALEEAKVMIGELLGHSERLATTYGHCLLSSSSSPESSFLW